MGLRYRFVAAKNCFVLIVQNNIKTPQQLSQV